MNWNDSLATLLLDRINPPGEYESFPRPRPWKTSCAMPDGTPVFIKLARHEEAYETERKTLGILNREGFDVAPSLYFAHDATHTLFMEWVGEKNLDDATDADVRDLMATCVGSLAALIGTLTRCAGALQGHISPASTDHDAYGQYLAHKLDLIVGYRRGEQREPWLAESRKLAADAVRCLTRQPYAVTVDDFRSEQVVIHEGKVSFVDYEFLNMNTPEHSLYWLTGGFMGKLILPAELVETYCAALAEQGFGGMDSQLVQERLDCTHILDAVGYFVVPAEVSFDPSSWPIFAERVKDFESWYQKMLEKLADTELYVSTGIGARIRDWLLGVG